LNSLILVFAKTPVLGKVKTRLAETLGDQKALWVYQQLLVKTDQVLKKSFSKVVVFYAGDTPSDFGNCFNDFPKKPQKGKHLGERMAAAFEWGFAQGYPKIIGIGTDLWTLNPGILQGALSALDGTEVVLGPSKDGGYYLLGMKTFQPELFKNKEWSGPEVFSDTLKDLQTKRVALLEEKSDIDFYKDLVVHLDLLTHMNQHFDEREN
jgi:rSAM/selenodomain-associated transferase 1